MIFNKVMLAFIYFEGVNMNITAETSFIKEPMDRLIGIVQSMPWEKKEFYSNYLAQTYHFVFHSCRLSALAISVTDKDQADYYRRSMGHIKEEDGHEALAITDLKRLGYAIEEFPENAVTRSLYEPQYFKTSRKNTSLVGYILALELVAVAAFKPVYERLLMEYGPKSTNFVRVHVEEDESHVLKAFEELNRLSADELEEVLKNYEQTCYTFGEFLQACSPDHVANSYAPTIKAAVEEARI